jgi:hypothetical protein
MSEFAVKTIVIQIKGQLVGIYQLDSSNPKVAALLGAELKFSKYFEP